MQAMWLVILIALWYRPTAGNSCPDSFFPANSDTCLHIGVPSMAKMEDYCKSLGSKLFGRPLSDEMAKSLADRIYDIAKKWMPEEAYLGMERAKDNYGKPTKEWQFLGEKDTFEADEFEWWHKDPKPEHLCVASVPKHDFKVIEFNCSYDIGSVCEKPDKPCYVDNAPYINYHGVCSFAISDTKRFSMAKESCDHGRLMHLTSENHYNSLIEAMYNTRFAGGIYIGLNKDSDGVWQYNNGEKETEKWAADDDNEFDCGGVRLKVDKTLGLYSIPCDKGRLHYLCEKARS